MLLIGGIINITSVKHIIITVLVLVFLTVIVSESSNLKTSSKPQTPNATYNPQAPVQITDGCKFSNLPPNYNVYTVSSYEGNTSINTIIDRSGNRNGSNDVIVNVVDKPIILVLTSYEPILWKIQSTAATKIIGLVLGGYYNQATVGLASNIPTLNYTYSQNTCGYFYLNNTLDTVAVQNIEKIQEITGRKPDNMQYTYHGGTFYVGNFASSKEHKNKMAKAAPPELEKRNVRKTNIVPQMLSSKDSSSYTTINNLTTNIFRDIEITIDTTTFPILYTNDLKLEPPNEDQLSKNYYVEAGRATLIYDRQTKALKTISITKSVNPKSFLIYDPSGAFKQLEVWLTPHQAFLFNEKGQFVNSYFVNM